MNSRSQDKRSFAVNAFIKRNCLYPHVIPSVCQCGTIHHAVRIKAHSRDTSFPPHKAIRTEILLLL
jgi:hypothetical protein